ncbi:tail fiber assembly protein [Pseudomonas abietaniphila]
MSNYAIVVDGIVINIVVWNGDTTQWGPENGAIALEYDAEETKVNIGDTWDGASFISAPAPPPAPLTSEQILIRNQSIKDSLLATATAAIAPLQDAVDLDEATADETALLKKWKQFRVAVNRVDMTPESPAWPEQPH